MSAPAIVMPSDGFAVQEKANTSLIIGRMIKFIDPNFIIDKTETMPANTSLVAIAVTTTWVHWSDAKPDEHRITQPSQIHPARADMPDQDESKWPLGLNGETQDPWKDSRYLRLIDPQSGADFTFVTDSYGGRKAIGDLKSQIANVRGGSPTAVPIVQLTTAKMSTRFGVKTRPSFKVIGWRTAHQEAPALKLVEQHKPSPPADNDMDDDCPF